MNHATIIAHKSTDLTQSRRPRQQKVDHEALETDDSSAAFRLGRSRFVPAVVVVDQHVVFVEIVGARRILSKMKALHQKRKSSVAACCWNMNTDLLIRGLLHLRLCVETSRVRSKLET